MIPFGHGSNNSEEQSGWVGQQAGITLLLQTQNNQGTQRSQSYKESEFPETMQQQKAYQGTSGWDTFMGLTNNMAQQNTNNPNNPYAQWDNSPVQHQHHQQNNQNFNQSQSLWNNLSVDASLSYILNPVFTKPAPKFEFPSPFMRYKVIPYLDDKMALDVASITHESKKLKKNNLIIWTYHGGPNQLFFFKKTKDGRFYIINSSKGFTVEVPESCQKQGEQIYANPRNDTQNQLWTLKPGRKSETYEIVSFCGKVLDCEGQSTKNGTHVIQWNSNGGKNQLWKIVPA